MFQKFLNFNLIYKRELLIDNLNAMKKVLTTKSDQTENKDNKSSESSIIFKVFTDLEATDIERTNKVSKIISNILKKFNI